MADTGGLVTAPEPARRRGLGLVGVFAVVAAALFGGNVFGVRDSVFGSATPAPRAAAVSPFKRIGSVAGGSPTVLRSQPWWQGLARLDGSAAGTRAFTVDAGASQWRARWSCRRGTITAHVAGRSTPLFAAACPASGTAYATRPGPVRLSVSAGGPWTVRVDQQVDVPLVEPPPRSIGSAGTTLFSSTRFYRIDQIGTGRVSFYRLSSGRYLLRLAGFYITPNVDLQLRLSPLAAIHTTHRFLSTPSTLLAPLDITAGSLNFPVPSRIDLTRYRTLVVWCPLINSAYAAAPLRQS